MRADGKSGRSTPLKIISSKPRPYPGPDGYEAQDALVMQRVCVSEEGKLDSLELMPTGFHTPLFVSEAELYARSIVFEPATLDGNPVASCAVLPYRFYIVGGEDATIRRGITADFRRELDEATRLVKEGDLAGAHHHTEYMLRDKVKLLYEYALLQARLADSYARAGNAHRAIEMARNAMSRFPTPFPKVAPGEKLPHNEIENYILPKEWLVELLTMRMRLAASNGLLFEALQAYYELASLTSSKPDPELQKHGQILEKAYEARGELSGKIVLGESVSWKHPLIYTEFTVSEVKGEIKSLTLVCGANVRALAYVTDAEWRVPPTWRDCTLNIAGEPDTALTLVEFPPAQ